MSFHSDKKIMFDEIDQEIRDEIRREFKDYFEKNKEGINTFEEADVILTAHQLKALEEIDNKNKSEKNVVETVKTDDVVQANNGNDTNLFEEFQSNDSVTSPTKICDEDDTFSSCGSLDFTPNNHKTGIEQLDDPNLNKSIESEAGLFSDHEFDFRHDNFLGNIPEKVAEETIEQLEAAAETTENLPDKQLEDNNKEKANGLSDAGKIKMQKTISIETKTKANIVEEYSPKVKVSSKRKEIEAEKKSEKDNTDTDSDDNSKTNDDNSNSDKSNSSRSDKAKADSNSSNDSSKLSKTRTSNKKKYLCNGGCEQIICTDIPSYCEKPHRLWNTFCHGCGVEITRSVMKATGTIHHCNKTGVFKNGVLLCSFVMCGKCMLEQEEANGKSRRRMRGH